MSVTPLGNDIERQALIFARKSKVVFAKIEELKSKSKSNFVDTVIVEGPDGLEQFQLVVYEKEVLVCHQFFYQDKSNDELLYGGVNRLSFNTKAILDELIAHLRKTLLTRHRMRVQQEEEYHNPLNVHVLPY